MPLENRNLEVGTRLVANYKKAPYVCVVEAGNEGKLQYRVEGIDKVFASPSSAGMAVMDGKAVNGWRFWSLEGEAKPASEDPASPKPARTKKGSGKKTIRRIPRPAGMSEDQSRWFCSACMKAFTVEGNDPPAACPENHPMEDLHSEELAS